MDKLAYPIPPASLQPQEFRANGQTLRPGSRTLPHDHAQCMDAAAIAGQPPQTAHRSAQSDLGRARSLRSEIGWNPKIQSTAHDGAKQRDVGVCSDQSDRRCLRIRRQSAGRTATERTLSVHVVIPVFNRLAMTQSLVACLREQVLNQPLRILIVNDGSSDGTAQWLAGQSDIEVLNGSGSLFWGGAVDLAVRHLKATATKEDWVLLINNDTTVARDFVQRLLDTAQAHAPAAVGSVIRDEADHARLLSIGPRIDSWRLLTRDFLEQPGQKPVSDGVVEVDALSGRGVLLPIAALIAAGGMRPRALPHYLADYEVSLRVRKSGWRLLVLCSAEVYSLEDYGSTQRALSWRKRFFSVRSPLYLPALLVFWWEASSWIQRLTLPLRLPLFILFPRLRKPLA